MTERHVYDMYIYMFSACILFGLVVVVISTSVYVYVYIIAKI